MRDSILEGLVLRLYWRCWIESFRCWAWWLLLCQKRREEAARAPLSLSDLVDEQSRFGATIPETSVRKYSLGGGFVDSTTIVGKVFSGSGCHSIPDLVGLLRRRPSLLLQSRLQWLGNLLRPSYASAFLSSRGMDSSTSFDRTCILDYRPGC